MFNSFFSSDGQTVFHILTQGQEDVRLILTAKAKATGVLYQILNSQRRYDGRVLCNLVLCAPHWAFIEVRHMIYIQDVYSSSYLTCVFMYSLLFSDSCQIEIYR